MNPFDKLRHDLEMAKSEIEARRSLLDELINERDALRAENERLKGELSHVLTSLDEGTLPWWQHKHDEAILKMSKIAIERDATLQRRTDALKLSQTALEMCTRYVSAKIQWFDFATVSKALTAITSALDESKGGVE